ncbi:stress response protein NST1-like [Pomacea canaliculata]|uniref:stress response protein NST1-like n=1 Tax=Pomacea canaliculata TaxID=400727 RepID=UPI000D72EB70|nr:stress response protein NST1-like [Pomacea canaliculata]XP_025099473.1 stress response protein NST1-like [Pomacea canaliculata]
MATHLLEASLSTPTPGKSRQKRKWNDLDPQVAKGELESASPEKTERRREQKRRHAQKKREQEKKRKHSLEEENTRLKTENEKLSRITEKLRFVANILQGVANHARESCNKMPTPEIPSSDMEQRNVPSTSHQSRVDQSPASTSGPTHDTSKMVAPPPPASWQKLNEAVLQPKFNFPFEDGEDEELGSDPELLSALPSLSGFEYGKTLLDDFMSECASSDCNSMRLTVFPEDGATGAS